MTSTEIHNNVEQIIANFTKEEFIFDMLLAYGVSKTSITRLKKGDFNLSKNEGEVLYKKKVFFKVDKADQLLSTIEQVAKDENILRHNPRFAIVTDYQSLVAKDLKLGRNLDIKLKELPNYYDFFLPLAGAEAYQSSNDNEADRNAAYKMGELYDILVDVNPLDYTDEKSVHNLNLFLSRLLFCFFAEDTGIFEDNIFTNTLVQHTNPNGGDTHKLLDKLFEKLDTESKANFPNYIAKLPYVNGGLFGGKSFASPKFNTKAHKTLVALGELQWQNINPDIFGSMIQAVVRNVDDDNTKHYTSVPNILKVIKPLFLDELETEFEKASDSIQKLRKLINRMAKIKFFDPACGSGNFLIIAYKEIRLLEIKILQRIVELSPNPTMEFTQIQLSQFYGIELDDFAHEMAILSLWLAEHQMNLVFEDQLFDYGQSKPILPLKEAGKIIQGNAARLDWKNFCPIDDTSEVYVFGNPPYLGKSLQNGEQKRDMELTFHGLKNYGNLDYIAIWFYKASQYIRNCNAKYAFVTTNSISQGEQVSQFWPNILSDIEIDFAYPSFKWTNNAKGNAGVTVIIVGLRNISNEPKHLVNDGFKKEAKNINAYLLDSADVIISGRSKPISRFPEITSGCKITDNGNLLLNVKEAKKMINDNPLISKFIKKFIGAHEFINGDYKYCVHVTHDNVEEAYSIKNLAERFDSVKLFRSMSQKLATQKKAATPHFFDEDKHKNGDYMLVPRHSSENRNYIPIGFLSDDIIAGDSALAIYNAQPWNFAVITSRMHMVWVRAVGGKLEERLRYSAKYCYNTFPFPDISIKQKETLNQYVFDILDERAKHSGKTMAQLYDPNKMPKDLKEAHQALDKAIEQCYRLQPFTTDTERLEYLFKMYEEMTKRDTLFAKQKKTRKKIVK